MTPQVTVALLPRRHKGGISEKTLGLPMRLKGRMDLGPQGLFCAPETIIVGCYPCKADSENVLVLCLRNNQCYSKGGAFIPESPVQIFKWKTPMLVSHLQHF